MKLRAPVWSIPGLILLGASFAAAGSGSRPNVLFLVADDLRPELGCYGVPVVSPNIDRLASQGVLFDRAYAQQAVCSPSRSSVMTGARPDTTKVWDLVTDFRAAMPDVITLGQHFKNHGYFSQGMGKIYHAGFNDAATWSVPWGTPAAPTYASEENMRLRHRTEDAAPRRGPKGGLLATPPGSRGPAYEGEDVPDDTFTDGKTARLAVETLRGLAAKNEPFFLAVGFAKPHLPFVSPKRYWDLYDPARLQLAPNPFYPKGAPPYAILSPGGEVRSYHGMPVGEIPPEVARRLKHAYYAATSYVDAQIGLVLDELERTGLRKNTIVVLWGDHGWKLGEHHAWSKHSNVENDTRVPLIISAPGLSSAGSHTRALAELVDIYPTLCDLAGLPLPSHLEGNSLKPVLEQPGRSWKPAAFSQYPRGVRREGSAKNLQLMGYSMRTDHYRLTVWTHRDDHSLIDAVELYDSVADPQENINIAGDPGQAEVVSRLMSQWRAGWQGARMALEKHP
ncbi:MAG: sulfatase [Opitutaceae bacterium]|nr:sulfatase [Opitutaceae bacterium]